jgi:hypothetical protein
LSPIVGRRQRRSIAVIRDGNESERILKVEDALGRKMRSPQV